MPYEVIKEVIKTVEVEKSVDKIKEVFIDKPIYYETIIREPPIYYETIVEKPIYIHPPVIDYVEKPIYRKEPIYYEE